jgi:single-strand DNA-binding protein
MSLNKVMLIGNVGKEPEVRHLDNGVACATLVLATSERGYTLQNGTQVPERTEWHNIVLWRGLADVVERYVHKGDKLFVEGKIRSRSYEDQNGNTRYVTEIFADNMEMLTPRQTQAPVAPGVDRNAAAQAAATAQNLAQNTSTTADKPEDLPF